MPQYRSRETTYKRRPRGRPRLVSPTGETSFRGRTPKPRRTAPGGPGPGGRGSKPGQRYIGRPVGRTPKPRMRKSTRRTK